jgi:hypothetical protein
MDRHPADYRDVQDSFWRWLAQIQAWAECGAYLAAIKKAGQLSREKESDCAPNKNNRTCRTIREYINDQTDAKDDWCSEPGALAEAPAVPCPDF